MTVASLKTNTQMDGTGERDHRQAIAPLADKPAKALEVSEGGLRGVSEDPLLATSEYSSPGGLR